MAFARWLPSRVNVLIYNLFPKCLVYIQIFTEFSRSEFGTLFFLWNATIVVVPTFTTAVSSSSNVCDYQLLIIHGHITHWSIWSEGFSFTTHFSGFQHFTYKSLAHQTKSVDNEARQAESPFHGLHKAFCVSLCKVRWRYPNHIRSMMQHYIVVRSFLGINPLA